MSDTTPTLTTDDVIHPRPNTLAPDVVDAAVALHREDLVNWWGGPEAPGRSEAQILQDVRVAIENADSIYGVVRCLDIAGWEGDDTLYDLVRSIVLGTIPKVSDRKVQAWVMLTGVRFPAKEGDRIEWSEFGVEFVGDVLAVIQKEARAIVKYGGYHLGMPNVSIPAEAVTRIVVDAPAETQRSKKKSKA